MEAAMNAVARATRRVGGRVLHPLVLVAVVATACGDRGPDDRGLARRESVAADGDSLVTTAVGGALGHDVTFRRVDYAMTDARYARWSVAQRNLERAAVREPSVLARVQTRASVRHIAEADIERAVVRLESDPTARRAVEAAGMSPREFVLATLALAQSLEAAGEPSDAVPPDGRGARAMHDGVAAANVGGDRRDWDELRRLRRDRRLIIDDADSDAVTNVDSDADSDADSDRRRAGGGRG